MDTNKLISSGFDKPNLLRFLSITSYLQAYYDYRKAVNPSFSYELWALELNFKSKSSLRMMAYGKRNVSEKLMASFAEKEKLSEKEKQFVILLSRLQNTQNVSLKRIFLDKIAELSDFSLKQTDIHDAFEFLSAPEMYLVQMLVSFVDFQATVSSLKQVLMLDVTKIQKTLAKLEKLNLIESYDSEISKDKVWKSKAKFFSVRQDVNKQALNKIAINSFHAETLKEAAQVAHQDIVDKNIQSLFFSLNEEDYKDLSEIIDQFTNRVKTKYANDFIENKKIYKMNLQLYPVTEACSQKMKNSSEHT